MNGSAHSALTQDEMFCL